MVEEILMNAVSTQKSSGSSGISNGGVQRTPSRRSRGERTRRRERYLQSQNVSDAEEDDDDDDDEDALAVDACDQSLCVRCGGHLTQHDTDVRHRVCSKRHCHGDAANTIARNSNNITASKPTKDHLYKILVIGDLGSGKTSIIKRYVHDFFSQHYRATIGVDFALKVLHWDANTVIRLQLWDIAGQERYGNMTRVYYKEAVGAFIVFDVTRSNTFESVSNWKADLDSKVQLPDGSPIPCVLLGNKCDQQKEGIVNSATKMNEFCKEKGFSSWFETSAKENINVEEATRALINEILTNDVINANQNQKDKDQFTLTNNKKDDAKNQKCYKC